MTAEEAFLLINNLDHEVEWHQSAPQWSTVVVNEHGTVVGVIRHQEQTTMKLKLQHLQIYPDTMQFTAWPGKFATVDELIKEIHGCRKGTGVRWPVLRLHSN